MTGATTLAGEPTGAVSPRPATSGGTPDHSGERPISRFTQLTRSGSGRSGHVTDIGSRCVLGGSIARRQHPRLCQPDRFAEFVAGGRCDHVSTGISAAITDRERAMPR